MDDILHTYEEQAEVIIDKYLLLFYIAYSRSEGAAAREFLEENYPKFSAELSACAMKIIIEMKPDLKTADAIMQRNGDKIVYLNDKVIEIANRQGKMA